MSQPKNFGGWPMTTTGIILAAGKGTRMRSNTPKSLHKAAGLPLVAHGVRTMRAAGIDDVIVVASQEIAELAEFQDAVSGKAQIVIQAEQRGTADAVRCARAGASGASAIVVAPVDMVLVTFVVVQRMLEAHHEGKALATVLGANVDNPSGFGRIRLDSSGRPVSILEEHEADDELRQSNLINTSWFCFDGEWIWSELDSIEPASTGEVYLPRTIESAAASSRSMIVVADEPEMGLGINDLVQLSTVERIMRSRINEAHMRNGVTLRDPATTYIDVDVEIGSDTEVGAGTHIATGVRIGKNVAIGPGSQIASSRIGDGVSIDGARVIDSVIGDGASVGPNSLVRSGSELKSGARVGNLAEIKHSVVGSNSNVSHFSYVGDAILGENVNVGAGTVTCNYDGKNKHTTVIEDGALIGSSTMLVAPVTIGKLARTGAGSVVRNDVAPGDTVAGVPAKPIK